MRRFSRFGLVLGLSLVVFGGVRRALRWNPGGASSGRPVLPRFRLLSEDGFGGPGVFERAVPPFEPPTSSVPETVETAAAGTATPIRARKAQATKPAAKKSPAKKSHAKKSPTKKSPTKKSPTKKSPAKKSSPVKSSRPDPRGSSRKA
jgi:hypothetical protein